jgi:hypothetical protein
MVKVIQAGEDVCGMEDRVLVLLGVDVCLLDRFYIHILYNLKCSYHSRNRLHLRGQHIVAQRKPFQ